MNLGGRQNLNPTLEPDDATCLLCQPLPLLRCRLVVRVPLIRFTPNYGYEARKQRTDSEDRGWSSGGNVKVLGATE